MLYRLTIGRLMFSLFLLHCVFFFALSYDLDENVLSFLPIKLLVSCILYLNAIKRMLQYIHLMDRQEIIPLTSDFGHAMLTERDRKMH